jgi:hypothetical protein
VKVSQQCVVKLQISVTPQKSHITRESNSFTSDHLWRRKYLIFLQNIGTLYFTTGVAFQKAVIFLIQFDGSPLWKLLRHNHTAKLFLKSVHTTGARDAPSVQTAVLVAWNTHTAMSPCESVFVALPLCWITPGKGCDLSICLGSPHETVHNYRDTHIGARVRTQTPGVWAPIYVTGKSEALRANKPSDGNNTALNKHSAFLAKTTSHTSCLEREVWANLFLISTAQGAQWT